MTQKDRATLLADQITNIPDNSGAEISPLDVRKEITNLTDSAFILDTDKLEGISTAETDTTKVIKSDGAGGLQWVADDTGGDMLKSVYDVADNGIVDDADKLGNQLPAHYLDRANHTGTQTASTISDFDTEVSNNTDVTNNSAKISADGSIDTHSDVDTTTTPPSTNDVLQWDGANFVPVSLPAGSDENLKVSADDTTAGYAEDKIVGKVNEIVVTTLNPAGNEQIELSLGANAFNTSTDTTDDVTEGTTNLFNANHTGDVTGATVTTISADVVDNSKLSDMPALTLKGNNAGVAGDPLDLSVAQVQTLLNIEDGSTKGIDAEDEGVAVGAGDFTTLNFVGAGVVATDAGAGQLDVTVAGGAGGLATKAGEVLEATFAGNPKTATVTFSSAFADANYSISLNANVTSNSQAYTPSILNKVAGSFDISLTTNSVSQLTSIEWIAVKHGES